jgi:thiol-disulfide isomerase/thioredoxin
MEIAMFKARTLIIAAIGLVPVGAWLFACVAASAAGPPAFRQIGAPMPRFLVDRWVNSPPLQPEGLRGKVVLVDFWEYTCVNWIRTMPFVNAWHARYARKGLVVIGVHSPEFDFGKRAENIDRGIRDHGLTYPIAIDNEFTTWTAFRNDAWPTKYLFDAQGKLRGVYIGEGDYPAIEDKIRTLLTEAGAKVLPPLTAEVVADRRHNAVARHPQSPETYLGAERSREGNGVARIGDWKSEGAYIEHTGGAPARIILDFVGGEVNLVLQPGAAGNAELKVKLDGEDVGARRGGDVGEESTARFDRSGMVRLVRGAGPGAHRLELETRDDGLRAYSFTFGP